MILLIGKSGSGKDYLVRAFGLRPVISRTTRPPRPGEDPSSHKFMTPADFLSVRSDQIVCSTSYNGYIYWTQPEDLIGKDVYIIDPPGLLQYIERFPRGSYRVVYLSVPWYRRFWRMMKRERNPIFAIPRSVKRLVNDFFHFRGFEKSPLIDYVIKG